MMGWGPWGAHPPSLPTQKLGVVLNGIGTMRLQATVFTSGRPAVTGSWSPNRPEGTGLGRTGSTEPRAFQCCYSLAGAE